MTRPSFFLTFFISGMIMLLPPAAQAAGDEAVSAMQAAKKDPALQKQEDKIENVHDMINEINLGLDDRDLKHFTFVYMNYNMVQTVRAVQADVENAVKECGKNNPDLKDRMNERFAEWESAVSPVIKESDLNIDNMVAAQDYIKPAKFRKVFKGLDGARKDTQKQIEKIPVTTPEACEYLLEKMDETQESMTGLLRTTLVSFGQMFPEDEKAEEEEKGSEKSTEEPEKKPAADSPEPEESEDQKQDE